MTKPLGKRKAAILLGQGQTPELLALVFQRIYTLRNQLIHRSATWHGKTNRAQVQDCATLMAHNMPVVLEPIRKRYGARLVIC